MNNIKLKSNYEKSSYHLITKNLKEYVQKIVEIEETLNKQ